MKKSAYFFILIFVTLAVAGCEIDLENLSQNPALTSQADKIQNSWQKIGDLGEYREYELFDEFSSREDIVTVVKIQPTSARFEINEDSTDLKAVFNWQEELGAQIVVNAAYFDEEYQPTGYLKDSQGHEFGKLYLTGANNYTGAVLVDEAGKLWLYYLPSANLELAQVEGSQAFLQTFPTLILPGGVKAEISSSVKTANRTVIAQSQTGDLYIFVSQQNSLTLAEMQDFIYNFEDQIDLAINLDGGTSSGLSIETNEVSYHLASFYVSSVLAIYEK